MSASIAGLGGALLGAMSTRAGGTDFASETSLPILLLVVLGGVASVSGALYGGLAYGLGLAVLQKLLPSVPDLAFLATGLAGLSIAYVPEGAAVRIAERVRAALSMFTTTADPDPVPAVPKTALLASGR
jgi:branched-chain amino acid transport system permease protein